MEDIEWVQTNGRCPYMRKIIKYQPGKLVFNGYFYLEDKTMPVKRIICENKKLKLVEITSKTTLDDTSVYGEYDEDLGGRACFFPTNIIELEYKIIKEIENMNEFNVIQKELDCLEVEILERDDNHRRIREEEEFAKRSEEWKNLDYKKFMETMRDDIDDI